MDKVAVLIHGMWGTPHVWRHWRAFLEERGWTVMTPTLRHHDAPPLDPPAALGATSLLDYVDDLESRIANLPSKPLVIGHSMGGLLAQKLAARQLCAAAVLLCPAAPEGIFKLYPSAVRALLRTQSRWRWWARPHRPSFEDAMYGAFNTCPDRQESGREYGRFVHESGRALLEIALPLFDRRHAARVDAKDVTCPMLVIGAGQDRLTPPGMVRRVAAKYAHVAEHREFAEACHWVLGQGMWRDIATTAADWADAAMASRDTTLTDSDKRRAWRSSISTR